MRPLLAASTLLLRRRARQDALLLVGSWALLTVMALLSTFAPVRVTQALDMGVRESVRALGEDADLRVTARLSAWGLPGDVAPASFITQSRQLRDALPEPLAAVTSGIVVSAGSLPMAVQARDGVPTAERLSVSQVHTALLDESATDGVTVLAGELPTDPDPEGGGPVEVVVPEAYARLHDLEPGSVLTLRHVFAPVEGEDVVVTIDGDPADFLFPPVDVLVVGVVRVVDATSATWRDTPLLWRDDAGRSEPVPVLTGPDGVTALAKRLEYDHTGTIRVQVDPDAFTAALAPGVAGELERVRTDPSRAGLSGGFQLRDPALAGTLATFLDEARAARAQMSLAVTGVVAVAAVVLLLTARLLVSRRTPVIALERARGASSSAVVLRAAAEAVLLTALAVGAATGIVAVVLDRPLSVDTNALLPVLLVGLLAVPVETARVARRQWNAARVPANPRDRRRLAKLAGARRAVVEAGVLVLAAAAVVALRSRGLLGGDAASGDPFLAIAPVLLTGSLTLVAARVHPVAVRALARVVRRSRGVLGVVGAARAQRVSLLPLLALALCAGMAVSASLLLDTVRAGQVAASWERVGADARVTLARLGDDEAAALLRRLEGAPGVTAVATAATAREAPLDLGARDLGVSVLVVDETFVELLRQVPGAGTDLGALAALPTTAATGGVAPVVVDQELARLLAAREAEELEVTLRGDKLPIEVVGTTDHRLAGQLPGPFLYLGSAAAEALRDEPIVADVAWVQGDGAAAALEGVRGTAVQTRADWLAQRTGPGLVGGVEGVMATALAVTAALAAIGLTVTVVAGARERGTTLALLRTIGMRPRLGWGLALAELGPVVLTALLAGSASGALVVVLLGPALGLDTLTGGAGMPTPRISPVAVAAVAGAAVLLALLAVLVEMLAHRRDGLNEVLRVGGT